MLLTADWHLTDSVHDEYRWRIFDQVDGAMRLYNESTLYILGDLTDRVDRHSSVLVNRMIDGFERLTRDRDVGIVILLGNHDRPISGPPYWRILSMLPCVFFIEQPIIHEDLALLPSTKNPNEAWANLDFGACRAVFMHQPVSGVVGNNGHTLRINDNPVFPPGLRIYSGDIHTPQEVNGITYVGAPYHIHYGDTYETRLLRLDDQYRLTGTVTLNNINKRSITARSLNELAALQLNPGDQLKVAMVLQPEQVADWPETKNRIRTWAKDKGVELAALEGTAEIQRPGPGPIVAAMSHDPEAVIRSYGQTAGLDSELLDTGLAILHRSRTA